MSTINEQKYKNGAASTYNDCVQDSIRFIQQQNSTTSNNNLATIPPNSYPINNDESSRQRMFSTLMRQIQTTNQIGNLMPTNNSSSLSMIPTIKNEYQQQKQEPQELLYEDYHHKSRQLSVSPISASSRSSSSCSLSCSTSPCSKQASTSNCNQNLNKESNDSLNQTSPKIHDDDLNNSNSSNSNVWRPW